MGDLGLGGRVGFSAQGLGCGVILAMWVTRNFYTPVGVRHLLGLGVQTGALISKHEALNSKPSVGSVAHMASRLIYYCLGVGSRAVFDRGACRRPGV